MSGKINILLVDDHSVVRAGFKRMIENQPNFHVVAEAENGEIAGQLYTQYHPDVVVMDLSLPGVSGLQTTQRILSRDARARVIIFSMHRSPVLVERALDAGVRGYVSKSCDPSVLVKAIEQVAKGDFYLGPMLAQEVALDRVRKDKNPLASLSPREFDIFRFVAEGETSSQIADKLHLSKKTVANNITRIKSRLKVSTNAELVLIAVRSGLIHP